MPRRGERAFVVLAVLALVGSVAGAAAAGGTAPDRSRPIAFEPPAAGDPADRFDPPEADGVATVEGERFDDLEAALAAADPGDTVRLRGRFAGPVNVTTPNLTLVGADGHALIDGGGEGTVLTVAAANVTLRRLWVRGSGFDAETNDAGVWLDGSGAALEDSRVTAVTFGVWVDGVPDVRIDNTTIVGREEVRPRSERGNGIQLWHATDAVVTDTRITDVRDGIYFSWASGVRAANNTMWDLRYGVHYMYSDSCRLANNTAVGNDAGYALMLSESLTVVDNRAVNNTGESGHGILMKGVDRSLIRGNDLVGNERGLFVYNSLDNTVAGNVVAGNEVGIHLAAGSVRERVYDNTILDNGVAVEAVTSEQVAWNASDRGNYWGGVVTVDRDGDGVSETRHRPAGAVQRLTREHPTARVFAGSPAFDAVRLAERSLPVVESPGVVDHHPLTDPPTDRWRRYYRTEAES